MKETTAGPGGGARTSQGTRIDLPGIVIADGHVGGCDAGGPRIAAFIWGGKVKPTPTLPFGRWKGAA